MQFRHTYFQEEIISPSEAVSSRSFVGRRLLVVGTALVLGLSLIVPSVTPTFAQTSDEERAALQAQLEALEAEISRNQQEASNYRKEGNSLSSEVGRLNANINALNAQIKAISVNLSQLNNSIGSTESQIQVTTHTLAENQEVLGQLLRKTYITEQAGLLEMIVKNEEISGFFNDVNGLIALQGTVKTTIGTIADLKGQLEGHKALLADNRDGVLTAKEYQAAQKAQTDKVKAEKARLLRITRGEEAKYQEIVKDKKAEAARIRTRLISFLGGGRMQFGDAYQLAKAAGDATNVRPALILAVLDRESALGKYTGSCNYKESMSPKNQPIFEELMAELGKDPNSVNVSCAIPRDGYYGGAMGPAQFIPSTWQYYKKRIAQVTGQNPPDPWNNFAAVTATSLYLSENGAVAGSTNSELEAAARYYAGGNWKRFVNTYGAAVINKADAFEDDIAILINN